MSYGLACIGPHFFYTPMLGEDSPNFEGIDQDTSFMWNSQNRIGRDPAKQFVGGGEDTISITGRLFPHHFGGLSTLEAIKASGREGKPHTFLRFHPGTDGAIVDQDGRIKQDRMSITGVVQGPPGARWVIQRVKRTDSLIGFSGVAHKIDFTIELSLFGEDESVEFVFREILGPIRAEPSPQTSGEH